MWHLYCISVQLYVNEQKCCQWFTVSSAAVTLRPWTVRQWRGDFSTISALEYGGRSRCQLVFAPTTLTLQQKHCVDCWLAQNTQTQPPLLLYPTLLITASPKHHCNSSSLLYERLPMRSVKISGLSSSNDTIFQLL